MNKYCSIFYITFLSITAATMPLHSAWANDTNSLLQHVILSDVPTSYKIIEKKHGIEVSATGKGSASGMYIESPLLYLPEYPYISWEWKVDKIQPSADITIKNKEDFPASIQFIFGEKNLFSKPTVLTYAWVSQDLPQKTVIKSPRVPNNFRTIILDNVQSPLSMWKKHQINIIEDYKLAYGDYPKKELSAFGFFTDNDQTQEAVISHYKFPLKNLDKK